MGTALLSTGSQKNHNHSSVDRDSHKHRHTDASGNSQSYLAKASPRKHCCLCSLQPQGWKAPCPLLSLIGVGCRMEGHCGIHWLESHSSAEHSANLSFPPRGSGLSLGADLMMCMYITNTPQPKKTASPIRKDGPRKSTERAHI